MDTLPWWKNEESVDEAHQRRMQTCNSQDGKKNDVILEPCETREHRMCNAVEYLGAAEVTDGTRQ